MTPTRDARTAKQLGALAILLVLLFLAILRPTVGLGFGALHSRKVQLGATELTVPQGWTLSYASGKMAISKPCYTIFCGSPRAGFVVETNKLPANSDEVWARGAEKVLQRLYPDASIRTVAVDSGRVKCVELDATADGKVAASCLNSNLRLTSTFKGESELKPVFYQVLTAAHRVE